MRTQLAIALTLVAGMAVAQNQPVLPPPTPGAPVSPPPPGGVQIPSPVATGESTRTSLFQTGMWFVGGRVGFTTSSGQRGDTVNTDVTGRTFSIAPRIGYYISDRFAIGANLSYDMRGNTRGTGASKQEVSLGTFGVGAFLRYANSVYNYYDCCHTLGYYIDFGVDYSTGTIRRTAGGATRSNPNSVFGVGVSPGIIWFPTPRIGLEASMGQLIRFSVTDIDLYADTDPNQGGGEVTVGLRTQGSRLDLLNLSTMGLRIGFNYYLNAGR